MRETRRCVTVTKVPRKQEPTKVELLGDDVSLSWVDLDYVRLTSVRGADLLSVATEVVEQFYRGDVIKRAHGGFWSDHVKYTSNRQARMVDVSGDRCCDVMGWLLDFEASCGGTAEFTRVDYAVDLRLSKPDSGLANRWYESDVGKNCRRDKLTGETLYLGSRLSPIYGRVYDKSTRYGDAPGAGSVWRFELEAKKVQARRLAKAWSNAEFKGQHIGAVIAHQFKKWGVKLPIEGLRVKAELAVITESATIQWLRHTVRPSIERLISAGRESQVKAALGEQVMTAYTLDLGL